MTLPHPQHLTWDDLDDLLMGTERPAVHVHLETCAECRALAAADLDVVVQVQRLPQFAPRAGFADRVLAGVSAVEPARLPVRPSARPWLSAASITLALAGLGTSLGWSLANQALLLSLRADAVAGMQGAAATVLQALNGLQQAGLVAALRDSVGGVGVGLIVTAVASAYLAGLLSLQRLVSVPGRAP
jgi:hypothetical protein